MLDSRGGDTLMRSLRVLRPGGKLISIVGPPDPDFAREQGMNWLMRQAMRGLSLNIRRKARRHGISYSFLFIRADGEQLSRIAGLVENGALRPVIDRSFAFEALNDALNHQAGGHATGKVVVTM